MKASVVKLHSVKS